MKQNKLPEITQPASAERVRFKDGMVVTAEDLDSAMHYPVGLFQSLLRAFFGCGVVCGLEVKKPEGAEKKSYLIQIDHGVALDCHGYPIELCPSVKMDLTPDPCDRDPPLEVCVAIRRTESFEHPRQMTDCPNEASTTNYQCTRIREQAVIKVFDVRKLPETLCAHPEQGGGGSTGGAFDPCQCLTTCPDDRCCGEAWVLLACITLDQCGGIKEIDPTRRKYVKPIGCMCQWTQQVTGRFEDVDKKLADLDARVKAVEPAARPTP